ncbi:hypothetical protein RUND412_004363 [Rhizina undulata]
MAAQRILVVGATGKQGGAVVDALLAHSQTHDFRILALTRAPDSPRAKLLAKNPLVEIVQGDPTAPVAIFARASPINAVFCVTVHGKEGAEEAQAGGLIDTSIAHGVKHFVFTSADRGGEKVSDVTPTKVPHIASKYRIEEYLKKAAAGTQMTWTMLRPVTFMENLTPDFVGKGFAAMWNQVGKRQIQLVAARDIGHFGAMALLEPERWAGKAVGIAGDKLNFEEACRVFKEVTGKDMPTTFCVVGTILKTAMPDIGAMFDWFKTAGYDVDIEACRLEFPELQDFATWLRTSSGFVKH